MKVNRKMGAVLKLICSFPAILATITKEKIQDKMRHPLRYWNG